MRENAPINLDSAVKKVHAMALQWLAASPVNPAAWGRTYTEPDKTVYLTAGQTAGLIAKWKAMASVDARFVNAGSDSSSGAMVDLKLQLHNADWGTYAKGTSPFVYHFNIDTYHSPEMIKAEEATKAQLVAAAQKKADIVAAAKKAADDKIEADKTAKAKAAADLKKKQLMATEWNAALKSKKPPNVKDKAAWEKAWNEKHK